LVPDDIAGGIEDSETVSWETDVTTGKLKATAVGGGSYWDED
jgi:hypothetical protein